MSIHNLNRLFQPRSVAVIGASPTKSSIGNILLSNLVQGSVRPVYAVNPKYDVIDGVACVKSVLAIKDHIDLAVVCTPAATVPDIVNECGQAGVSNVLVISAGFREVGARVGAGGCELEEAVQKIAYKHQGLRIIGPNCLGILSPHCGLNASFANQLPKPGRTAFISQSGAICTAAMDWALSEGIGFSAVASLGNTLDVDLGDMIDYLATDPNTDSIVMYIESIGNARKFMSAARAFTRRKPIVAIKSGRFSQSAKAAASHTGALVGEDSIYDAAFARAGIVRVNELMELFNCAEMLSRGRLPTGSRLAIVTNAGGLGIMALDAVLARHGTLAKLADSTIASLDQCLPSTWSRQNPVDILGDAPPDRYRDAVNAVLNDDLVDAVIVLLTPQAMTDPEQSAIALIDASRIANKPVLAVWMGGQAVAVGIERLNQASIPTFSSPEQAVDAFVSMNQYVQRRQLLDEAPHERAVEFQRSQAERDATVSGKSGLLNEMESKVVLAAYDIPTNETCLATNANQAVAIAQRMNCPVALKIVSPDIPHKSNVGGVVLNLRSDEVLQAFEKIMSRAKKAQPDARLKGVTVQPMVSDPNAIELIVGVKRDPTFGTVLMIGAGGIMAELIRDRVIELPPLNDLLARRMLETMQAWPLLNGFRGRPPLNVEELVSLLIRLSYLVAERPEIVELDINPLLVTPQSILAVDARMVLSKCETPSPVKPFSHLAIRPYPIGFAKTIELPNGQVVQIRPIRPDDEERWIKMLESCSTATIHNRFGGLVHQFNHELAARFCNIDYDRELAMVAEVEAANGQKSLIGVARLVAYSDGVRASLSFLVGDAWQHLGLATQLTEFCMRIVDEWKISEVIATTTTQNQAARRLLQGLGFDETLSEEGMVFAKKVLR